MNTWCNVVRYEYKTGIIRYNKAKTGCSERTLTKNSIEAFLFSFQIDTQRCKKAALLHIFPFYNYGILVL